MNLNVNRSSYADGDSGVTVVGDVDAVDADQPPVDHKATISDDTGSIEATVWDESVTLAAGDTVLISGGHIDTFDGDLQLNINDGATVERQQTDDDDSSNDPDDAGDLEADDDPDDDPDADGDDDPDGGDDLHYGRKRAVYQELTKDESGDKITVAGIAKRVGLSEQEATDILNHIATKDKKIERIDDGYRVL